MTQYRKIAIKVFGNGMTNSVFFNHLTILFGAVINYASEILICSEICYVLCKLLFMARQIIYVLLIRRVQIYLQLK